MNDLVNLAAQTRKRRIVRRRWTIAGAIGATAAVTMASDAAGLPNPDKLGEYSEPWQVESPPEALEQATAAILAGELPTVYFRFERYGTRADLPAAWPRVDSVEALRGTAGPRIAVTDRSIDPAIAEDGGPLLVYRPRTLVLGVGCSTDAPADEVEALARMTLADAGLALGSVRTIATIDRRVKHPAIVQLAERASAGCVGYTSDELAAVTDVPSPSAEVLRHVGILGVCEPAALLASIAGTVGASQPGTLLVSKQKSAHATVAVAQFSPMRCSGYP